MSIPDTNVGKMFVFLSENVFFCKKVIRHNIFIHCVMLLIPPNEKIYFTLIEFKKCLLFRMP